MKISRNVMCFLLIISLNACIGGDDGDSNFTAVPTEIVVSVGEQTTADLEEEQVLTFELGPGETLNLDSAVLDQRGNEMSDVEISWSLMDGSAGNISADGMFTATDDARGGTDTITGEVVDTDATVVVDVTVRCVYPAGYFGSVGSIMPEMSWYGAYKGDGTPIDFHLSDQFCGTAAERDMNQYDSIVMYVGTGWCPYCPDYIMMLDGMAAQIEANNGLLVFLEVQDASYNPATNLYSHQYISSVGATSGIRIGDNDNSPVPNVIANSPSLVAFPTAFIIRTRDMQVIADQNVDNFYLDFVGITADPEAEVTGGVAPEAGCGPEDEESYEPNDVVEQGGTIAAGSVAGGVCDVNPDFYFIDIEGDWSATLDFSHNGGYGDLDMYVWDSSSSEPLMDSSGYPVGSDGVGDQEYFEYSGPSDLFIYGYNGATSAYTLTIDEL